MPLSEFGREYLLLGLRMGKVIDQYVDSYFGPCELKQLVEHEDEQKKLPSPPQLLITCRRLQKDLPNQGFSRSRVSYLEKMLSAMETSLELHMGKEISYIDQVKKLYDITPQYLTDSEIFRAVEKINSFYEGSGSLLDRIRDVYKRREVPKDKILELFNQGMGIVRQRTIELFPDLLPAGEKDDIAEVHKKAWYGYNWYLGDYQSRFDINTDRTISWHSILNASAHEGYPGHHAESCIKDKLLYHEKAQFEHCLRISFSPQMVLYEGAANLAVDILFTLYEQEKISYETFCLNPSEESILDLVVEKQIWLPLQELNTSIAYHMHVDNWSPEEITKFLLDLGIMPKERISQQLIFINSEPWKSFHFNYYVGKKLIQKKFGERPSPQDFTTVLVNPLLPSDFA